MENREFEQMAEAGLHLGHRISKLHPKMKEYVVGIRNTVHIIDLRKTEECLDKALEYMKELFKKGGKMIMVGTKPPLRNLVMETALAMEIPYVSEEWLGGTFTNFRVISKRIQYFNELTNDKKEGKLDKYSKKERIKKEKELNDMGKKFEGIKDLDGIPDAVFICDIYKDKACLKEAKMKGIKTIAIIDTNVDPASVDYPIPGNDDAISAVKYILNKVKQTKT